MRWGAVIGRLGTWRMCFLIGQRFLEVREPGLTTVMLIETEGNVPDGTKVMNAFERLSQSHISAVQHTHLSAITMVMVFFEGSFSEKEYKVLCCL